MDRLNAALARFFAALDVLESRVGEDGSSASGKNGKSELAELRAERQRLLARIASLEEESTSVVGLAESVELRLDGAIAEIRAALDRG